MRNSKERSLNGSEDHLFPISWYRGDFESRLGFRGGRFLASNLFLAFLIGALATAVFYGALLPFEGKPAYLMFYERGPTQHAVMLLTFWSLAILGIKWLKLRHQRKMLNEEFLPDRPDFVLGTSNVDTVLDSIHDLIDDPSRFVLTNRIKIALSNLKNLGRVSDVDDIFRSQADTDESLLESTYSILNGFIWAIPVLGFIGTVLGLSESISSFGGVLKDSKADMQAIKANLTQVTSGLATAFETTLVALVAALIVQLLATFLRKNEQTFLDDCSEYCLRKIVNRIRIISDHQN